MITIKSIHIDNDLLEVAPRKIAFKQTTYIMKSVNYLLLLLLATLWGPSFLFIKIAGEEMQPLTLAAFRIGIAAILLGIYVFVVKGQFVKNLSFWMHVAVSGFFAQGLPFVLINWGEQYISSALAAILNGLTPLFTILIAHQATKTDKLNSFKVIGALFGFLGLCVLVSPSFQHGLTGSTMGIIAVTLAALSYAIALIYSKTFLQNSAPLTAPAGQLIMSSIYLIPMALFIETPDLSTYSWNTWIAVSFLAVLGTALAFVVYFKLLMRTNSSFVSQVTYLMPLFGVLLGYIFLNEELSGASMLAGLIILMGLLISNQKKQVQLPVQKVCTTPTC